MDLLAILLKYKWVILFYLALIIFLIWKRKRIAVQAKIIVLYRTALGIKFIRKMANKFKEQIILFGYIGVGAAYVGLIFISFVLIYNLFNIITDPGASSGVSLVLPGINIPGIGVLSFWYWLIAIFVIALVHEFGHGVVAKAHGLKIKSTGLVFLGPILGAFVEPDEKKISKSKDIVQYSVYAAGPFINIVMGIVAILLVSLVFAPVQNMFLEPAGFSFTEYYGPGYPAETAGLKPGMIINQLNDKPIDDFMDFYDVSYCSAPGDDFLVGTDQGSFLITSVESPEVSGKSFIGVKNVNNEFVLKEKFKNSKFYSGLYFVIDWVTTFFKWLYLLSLGIGLFNLLPLPIVDGGRIFKLSLEKFYGKFKGGRRFGRFALLFLLLLLANLLVPAVRWLLNL